MRHRFLAAAVAMAAALCSGACGGDARQSSATDGAAGDAVADQSVPSATLAAPPMARRAAKEEGLAVAAAPGAAPVPPGAPSQLTDSQASIVPAMLIRTGEATVEVRQLDTAVAAARRMIESLGGFVGGMSVQGGRDEVRTATLVLKLPAQRFEQAMAGLGGLGKVEHQSASTEDVGEEFADLTARMANARRLEARLLDLLTRRTGKLEEVLAVERELSRVREEIERMEGRSRYLRSRAAVSTLTLTLHEPRPLVGTVGTHPIAEAFRDAWRNFVRFVASFIASLGVLMPLTAIVAALVWGTRRLGWWSGKPRPPGGGSEAP